MVNIEYQKLDPIEHIHKRPDMYIGSLKWRLLEDGEWICGDDENKIILQKPFQISDGLLRIFVEALSNAIDNVWRSRKENVRSTKIKITIDDDKISVWNDGLWIPIEMHNKEKIYNPELIFGHLLTGSNMNDEEERLSSGRNGLGIKLLNVFSKLFRVECYDPKNQLLYRQKWENNMKTCHSPTIKSNKTLKSGYTLIEWKVDYEKFDCTSLSENMLRLYKKYLFDTAYLTKVSVYLNGTKIPISSTQDYVGSFDVKEFIVIPLENNSEVVIGMSPSKNYHEIGFVNGVYTRDGGVHCDSVVSELIKHVIPKCGNRSKFALSWKEIKPFFFILVNAWLPNPEFNSQSKTKLMAPQMPFSLQQKHLNAIMKWSFVEQVKEMLKDKEFLALKKTEKKGKQFRRIDGLDQANLAGTKHSSECTLILCEGLSAKTYASIGINVGWNQKKGRDYFGIMPLRGKCLNVRNANMKTISENKEITDMIHTLGLKYNVDYTDDKEYKTLRYGRILIITDADEDGHHICGLILNLFHKLFPSLLKRDDYFYIMMTPIARIFLQKDIQTFYNDFEYQAALQSVKDRVFRVKYYKGLGTSSDQEVKDTFGQKVVQLQMDESTDSLMDRVFHKSFSEHRKEWLTLYNPKAYTVPLIQYPISQFLNQELIKFSIEDCRRSIPNLYDGLKVSQRKILYAVFKKNLCPNGKSMKVAQLAGYCAEHSNYHHGEQCLYDTIIKMSHDFVGSNNVAFLTKDGQFGSRSYGGKDAANARYIFTKLTPQTKLLFPSEDDHLLTYTLDDGDRVEPDFYLPILPTILLNGCMAGIGTGWSCSVPCFSYQDLYKKVLHWLDDDSQKTTLKDLMPSYNGFKGTITKVSKDKYQTTGILNDISTPKKRRFEIKELPIHVWTNRYKEELEMMMESKKIKKMENYSTPNDVHFVIEPSEGFTPTIETMKLSSFIYMSNMVLFTKDYKLQKYSSIDDIFHTYCEERLELYRKRKKWLIHSIENDLMVMKNKKRFIKEVQENKLVVFRRTESDVVRDLEIGKYDKWEDGYDYLWRIPMRDFTKEKVSNLEKQIDQLKKKLEQLQKWSEQDLWKQDLLRFMETFDKNTDRS